MKDNWKEYSYVDTLPGEEKPREFVSDEEYWELFDELTEEVD